MPATRPVVDGWPRWARVKHQRRRFAHRFDDTGRTFAHGTIEVRSRCGRVEQLTPGVEARLVEPAPTDPACASCAGTNRPVPLAELAEAVR